MHEKICLNCEKRYTPRSNFRRSKYCSSNCFGKTRIGRSNNFWGKKHSLTTRNRFIEVWKNRKAKGYSSPNKQDLYKSCLICGKEFKVIKSTYLERKTCSMSCKKVYCSEYIRGKEARNWIDGRSYFPYPAEFNKIVKAKIRNRDGGVCRNCGTTEDLSVHHINYDKKDCREENLITLCLTCNSLANGNRDKWQRIYQNKICQI